MDKDLELHIQFDIQQLNMLWDKLTLYPEAQKEVQNLIETLKKLK